MVNGPLRQQGAALTPRRVSSVEKGRALHEPTRRQEAYKGGALCAGS